MSLYSERERQKLQRTFLLQSISEKHFSERDSFFYERSVEKFGGTSSETTFTINIVCEHLQKKSLQKLKITNFCKKFCAIFFFKSGVESRNSKRAFNWVLGFADNVFCQGHFVLELRRDIGSS